MAHVQERREERSPLITKKSAGITLSVLAAGAAAIWTFGMYLPAQRAEANRRAEGKELYNNETVVLGKIFQAVGDHKIDQLVKMETSVEEARYRDILGAKVIMRFDRGMLDSKQRERLDSLKPDGKILMADGEIRVHANPFAGHKQYFESVAMNLYKSLDAKKQQGLQELKAGEKTLGAARVAEMQKQWAEGIGSANLPANSNQKTASAASRASHRRGGNVTLVANAGPMGN